MRERLRHVDLSKFQEDVNSLATATDARNEKKPLRGSPAQPKVARVFAGYPGLRKKRSVNPEGVPQPHAVNVEPQLLISDHPPTTDHPKIMPISITTMQTPTARSSAPSAPRGWTTPTGLYVARGSGTQGSPTKGRATLGFAGERLQRSASWSVDMRPPRRFHYSSPCNVESHDRDFHNRFPIRHRQHPHPRRSSTIAP